MNAMEERVSAECRRQGAWGFLGEGVGANLLCPDTGTVLTKNHFFGELIHPFISSFFKMESEKYRPLSVNRGISRCTAQNNYFIILEMNLLNNKQDIYLKVRHNESTLCLESPPLSPSSRSGWVPASQSSCPLRSGDGPDPTQRSQPHAAGQRSHHGGAAGFLPPPAHRKSSAHRWQRRVRPRELRFGAHHRPARR